MHDKRKLIGVFHVGTKTVQFAVSALVGIDFEWN